MKHIRCAFLLLLAFFSVACGRSNIISDTRTMLVAPAKTLSVACDSTFNQCLSDLHNCIDIQIVNDTLMVTKDQIGDLNDSHFKVYSTNTFEYLGAIIRKGRGPGELISPYVMKSSANSRYLMLTDRPTEHSYMIDVQASLDSGVTEIVQKWLMPVEVIDWIKLSDNKYFAFHQIGDGMQYSLFSGDQQISSVCRTDEKIDVNRHATYMSSVLLTHTLTNKVAVVMMFFPQINIIDVTSGEVCSIAVSKDISKWEIIMNQMLTPHTKQYYIDAACTSKYIFATYKNLSLNKLNDKNTGTSIHVFDWSGKFLYEIMVPENISEITVDEQNGYLYCIDSICGCLLRYDLKKVI